MTLPESRKAVEEIARAHPRLVTHRDQVRPFLGGAMRDAFEWARGTHVLMMASDLETDPHCVKDMIAKAREGWDRVSDIRSRRRCGSKRRVYATMTSAGMTRTARLCREASLARARASKLSPVTVGSSAVCRASPKASSSGKWLPRAWMVADPVGRREAGASEIAIDDGGPGAVPLVRKGPVEPQEGLSRAGRVVDHVEEFVTGHLKTLEQGVGENLGQFGFAGWAVLTELAQIDVVGLGQAKQKLGRNRPLVALDVIQIAGRDPQIGRHGGLGQVSVAPHPLQPGSQKQLSVRDGIHGLECHNMTNRQESRYDKMTQQVPR